MKKCISEFKLIKSWKTSAALIQYEGTQKPVKYILFNSKIVYLHLPKKAKGFLHKDDQRAKIGFEFTLEQHI